MQLFGMSPFCKLSKCRSTNGEVELQCTNPFRGQRISIHGKADVETFQTMSAPLPNGHTPWYCHESFEALYSVTLYEKQWFQKWEKVEVASMDNSALEFGGDWSHWWKSLTKERQEGLKHGKYE